MVRDCHPEYDLYQLFSDPAIAGFGATARYRTWVVAAHRRHSVCLHDPFELAEKIENAMNDQGQCSISDYLVASDPEIFWEVSQLAMKRLASAYWTSKDPYHVLLLREQRVKNQLDEYYRVRFQELPSENIDLCYFLGDSEDYRSWSAVSHQIPTYRMNSKSGLYWLPSRRRWLTTKERLVSMGFPVTPEQSACLDVPCLGSQDTVRAGDMLGNAMHFQVSGIMQLIALSCFGPWS